MSSGNLQKKERRNRRCWEQELAKKLGISASAVGMYEQSRREPPCQMLVALARIFHVSTDFLLTGESAGLDDPERLRAYCRKLLGAGEETLVLRDKKGGERTFCEEDLALLLAAILR